MQRALPEVAQCLEDAGETPAFPGKATKSAG
jgi:hypothetical protein